MDTQLKWIKTGTFSVSKIAFSNGEAIKAVPLDQPGAIGEIEFGTELLLEAGLPVLPIKRDWRDGECWYYVQDQVETDFQWTFDLVSIALEIAEQAFEVGVYDLYPDNWGLKDGELVIIDAGKLTEGVEDVDQIMFAESQHTLLYAAD